MLIVMEGTDCSGKETQSRFLCEELKQRGFKAIRLNVPFYGSPTGDIIGGPLLGKPNICNTWFSEGAAEVDPKVASLYYAADRRYNADKILNALRENDIVVLDRYVTSNMAHQGCKFENAADRERLYRWLEKLEYEMLELPRPNLTIFLYMPYEAACMLKKNRAEKPDAIEENEKHLRLAEKTYLEIADGFGFEKVECFENGRIKSVEEIGEIVLKIVQKHIKN